MQVACQMVHWIQQALIERSMDGEARVNKNEGGSADHAKGHDEISHDQETVSSEVHEERGGDEEVHEARESDERARRARAGCDGVQTSALPLTSEDHTSELQSPDHLVCRLLLEPKHHTPQHQ